MTTQLGWLFSTTAKLVQQIELHRKRYSGRPIEYAFTDLENSPQVIIDALRKVGDDVTQVAYLDEGGKSVADQFDEGVRACRAGPLSGIVLRRRGTAMIGAAAGRADRSRPDV